MSTRHRGAEDRRRRVVVVAFVRVDEQRDERRGEHAAEDELEHDVRRVVRDVVGVGQRRAAERVGQRPDADEPGEARQRGAERDAGARSDEAAVGEREVGGRRVGGLLRCVTRAPPSTPARRFRRDRQMWLPHQIARKSNAPTVSSTPMLLKTVERTVICGRVDRELVVGGRERDPHRERARRAGLDEEARASCCAAGARGSARRRRGTSAWCSPGAP